ncbi:MAG: hydrogen peroxide-inducible genes activator [Gammaproteobacteria bacterium]|nr:hydrogen peroxide-inducible genes activator [Pseudomonadales bacterium]MCP5346579.1 hydrogen peroxide-inducible genes activator [Pseudomonadales bacterium]
MSSFPTFKQLKYLCAVAEHRHFSKAAEACHVTQSTLSAGIQELESQLGVTIFERNKKNVLITPLGEKILRQARLLLGNAEDLVAIAHASQDPLSSDVRLGVIPTIGPFLLPQMLTDLRREYPRLKLFLKEDLSAELVTRLQQGELDLILLALPYPLPDMHVENLFSDEFELLLPPGHPLQNAEHVQQKQLQGEKLLLLEEGHCLRDHALEACKLESPQLDLVYQGTSLHTLVEMVANGLGVTLLPEIAVKANILGKSGLELKKFKDGRVARRIGLAWRNTDPRDRDYLALAEFIRAWVKKALKVEVAD